MGAVANKRLAAQRRKISRHIELSVRQAEQRCPEAAERRARLRSATRAGKSAGEARKQAERRLADALRRLVAEELSIRESAERVGVTYHAARSLIRAAEVADAVRDENVGGPT
ncbi:MAG: hypothetical protein WB797_05315 [Nocardioides sp.]